QAAVDENAIANSSGRVTANMLKGYCNDVAEREVFVCGPEEFMSYAQQILTQLSLPAEQYHQESFVIDSQVPSEEIDQGRYKLKFLQSGLEVEVDGDQTILDAAEQMGIYPDYSCLAGICGSCNSQLVSGTIHAPDAMALDEEDKANGEFLPCCSYARSDLEIDL
ncbi:MAG: ferredoxin, partial [Oceanospirillaceae bacterium]